MSYDSYKEIVWLASYPKSGNTWVRCFLDAYLLGSVDINALVCSVTDDRADRYQIGDGSDITKLPVHVQQLARPMSMLRLVRTYQAQKTVDVPLFVKTHEPNMVSNGIELLPESLTRATIFLVRDPRDAVVSFAKHMGGTLEQGIEWMQDKYRVLTSNETRVANFIGSWGQHTNSYLISDTHNILVVRYEDMQARPEQTFASIVKHAGLPLDKDRVRMALEETKLGKLRAQEQEKGFIESSPHAKDSFFGTGGSHKEELSPLHRRRIEKAFGRIMKRLGYLDRAKAA